MRRALIVIIFALFLGAIFFDGAFSRAAITLADHARAVFALPYLLARQIGMRVTFAKRMNELALENQSLRALLFRRDIDAPELPKKLLPAKVHAMYPFHNKGSVTVAAGSSDGVREGQTVLAAEGVFFGQVTRVADDWSEVRTIFDAMKETPVRIGKAEVPALLRGGANVGITLIPKGRRVVSGDRVYTASKDFPYGLLIGDISDIKESPSGAFSDGVVIFPYTIADLAVVYILLAP